MGPPRSTQGVATSGDEVASETRVPARVISVRSTLETRKPFKGLLYTVRILCSADDIRLVWLEPKTFELTRSIALPHEAIKIQLETCFFGIESQTSPRSTQIRFFCAFSTL